VAADALAVHARLAPNTATWTVASAITRQLLLLFRN
jgi:hypothetical protein